MKNPFKKKKPESVLTFRAMPTDFRDLPVDEQLDWCRDLLQGLVDQARGDENQTKKKS